MPALGPATGFGDSLPRAEELPEGTELEIIEIGPIEKTAKNGYEYRTFTTADGTKYFTMATGIKNKLALVEDLEKKGELKYGRDDPLTCRTTRYEAHGRSCAGLG